MKKSPPPAPPQVQRPLPPAEAPVRSLPEANPVAAAPKPAAATVPVAPAEPDASKPPIYVPPPLKPWGKDPAPTTPTVLLRTMDHLKAYVIMNGERVGDTSFIWGYSTSFPFDPAISVSDWPPKGAAFICSRQEESRSIELYIEGGVYDLAGRDRIKQLPSVERGEQILYVKAEIQGKAYRGALRLRIVGTDGSFYRYTNFNPAQSEEEDKANLFAATVWFQRERRE